MYVNIFDFADKDGYLWLGLGSKTHTGDFLEVSLDINNGYSRVPIKISDFISCECSNSKFIKSLSNIKPEEIYSNRTTFKFNKPTYPWGKLDYVGVFSDSVRGHLVHASYAYSLNVVDDGIILPSLEFNIQHLNKSIVDMFKH